jgi:hypothetical protein
LSDAQRERLRELYVAGVTSGTICRELGINHPTVVRCLKETGRPRRRGAGFGQPRHPNGKLSEAEVAELRRLYKTTMPLSESCARLSIGRSSAYCYATAFRRAGVARRS